MAQRSNDGPARVVSLTGASQQAVAGACVYLGLDVNDDDSGNVHVHVYDGTDNTGKMIASAVPANGGHDIHWVGECGIACETGLFVEVVTGTPEGSVFYR